jgi:hypothetical protein
MEKKANSNGGIMKNEMPFLLLDEKIWFIRLPAYMVNRSVTETLSVSVTSISLNLSPFDLHSEAKIYPLKSTAMVV